MVFIDHFVMMMTILTSFKRVIPYLPLRHQRPSNWKTYAQKEVNHTSFFANSKWALFYSKLAEEYLWRLVSFTGSLLANLNHNNLKYGTEISRTPSFMQGAMTPLTASPNKNLGPEKMILLVCNRACSGHQGKRYYSQNIFCSVMLTCPLSVLWLFNTCSCLLIIIKIWCITSQYPVFGCSLKWKSCDNELLVLFKLYASCCFRFGLPFVLYMERTVTWDALQKEILEKMRHLLRPGVYIQVALKLKWKGGWIRKFVFQIWVRRKSQISEVILYWLSVTFSDFTLTVSQMCWSHRGTDVVSAGWTFQPSGGWRRWYHLPPSSRWATTVSSNCG